MKPWTKAQKIGHFYKRLSDLGISNQHCDDLRRIEMTLSRWGEELCNGTIQEDEDTKKFYRWYEMANGEHVKGGRVPNREAGALKRAAIILARYPDLWYYYQGDPRGCSLYVGRKSDIPAGGSLDSLYTRGVAVCY